MRVFVTGGTGYTGPGIVRAILAHGHEVTALVHAHRGPFPADTPGLSFHQGDVTDPASFKEAVRGHDAVVHLVAIRRAFPHKGVTFDRFHTEATRHVVDAAKAAGVQRFLYMSASGVRPEGTDYQRTKWESEALVKESGIPWTIFRPTFITGPAEDGKEGFDHEFADIARKSPVLPSFGGGDFSIQPVAKRDVGEAYARALTTEAAHGQTYLLAGPRVLAWNEYLRTLCDVLGKKRALAPVPKAFILAVAGGLGRFAWFPASRDELVMLMEGHTGDGSPAARDLGFTYTPYETALAEALGRQAGGAGGRAGGRAARAP